MMGLDHHQAADVVTAPPLTDYYPGPKCFTEQFAHNSEATEIAGSVERCTDSTVTNVQMDITGSGIGSFAPNFISAVSFAGLDTPWETTAQNGSTVSLKLQTMAVNIEPMCVTVFGGERICTLMTEKAKQTLYEADALIEAAVASRQREHQMMQKARKAEYTATMNWAQYAAIMAKAQGMGQG
jgi:hypothetical protein